MRLYDFIHKTGVTIASRVEEEEEEGIEKFLPPQQLLLTYYTDDEKRDLYVWKLLREFFG